MSYKEMGAIGKMAGKFIGQKIGELAGKKLGKYTNVGADKGAQIGESCGASLLENLIPFKKGGPIKKTGPILAHKGEYILPKGVRPTSKQRAMVKKRRSKKASKKYRKRK